MEDKLNQLKIENYIWVIYLGIIFLSWYSNYLEKRYFLYNEFEDKTKYRNIMLFIFSILVIVYSYFFISSYKDFVKIDFNNVTYSDKLVILSFIGSLLVLISGIIFLYIIYMDDELKVEIAFN